MADQNEFITHFEVSNFKKFDHLVVENIGQFNLITGDNNVGKTCLMEALTIDFHNANSAKINLGYLSELLLKRGFTHNIERTYYREINSKENYEKNEIAFYTRKKEDSILIKKTFKSGLLNKYELSNLLLELRISDKAEHKDFINKVNLFGFDKIKPNSKNWIELKLNNEIVYLCDILSEYYRQIKLSNRDVPFIGLKDTLNDYLYEIRVQLYDNAEIIRLCKKNINNIFPNINIDEILPKFEGDEDNGIFIEDIRISVKGDNKYYSVYQFGYGLVKLLHILLLILSGHKYIFIDEIDTGIHFSKLKEFWQNIITLCSDLNIQLFATTHSQECIEAYAQALEELGMEEKGRLIELEEYTNKEGKVKQISTTYTHSDLVYRLHVKDNLRGESRI